MSFNASHPQHIAILPFNRQFPAPHCHFRFSLTVVIQVLKAIISPDCSCIRNMFDNFTPQANALPYSVGGAQIEILKTFIPAEVVPNIHKWLLESCALVFGNGLLWFIYCNHAVSSNVLPQQFKNQIQNELTTNKILTATGSFINSKNLLQSNLSSASDCYW
jgi:hypothetical protein